MKRYHYIWKTQLIETLRNHHTLGLRDGDFCYITNLHSQKHPLRDHYEWDTKVVHSNLIEELFK